MRVILAQAQTIGPTITVPGICGRIARPSAKSGLTGCELNQGWKSMSCTRWIGLFGLGAERTQATAAKGSMPSSASSASANMIMRGGNKASVLHSLDRNRIQRLQERMSACLEEAWIA